MSDSLKLTVFIPASPAQVYEAWLNSEQHTAMTGAEARLEPREGAAFVAWDGYIRGTNVALEPARSIRQSWRATDFPDDARDSQLTISLEPEGEGTRLTLKHSGIPDGRAYLYEQGWQDYYLEPMREYFVQKALAILERRGDAPSARQAAEAGQAWTEPEPEPEPQAELPERPKAKAKPAAKQAPKKTTKKATKKTAAKKAVSQKPTARQPATKKPTTKKKTESAPKRAATKAQSTRKGTKHRK
jgi:uncharacterized protein YndB with AHSA1/START domain